MYVWKFLFRYKHISHVLLMNFYTAYLDDVYWKLAMNNYPYETNFRKPLPAYPVRMFCGQLDKPYKGEQLVMVTINLLLLNYFLFFLFH